MTRWAKSPGTLYAGVAQQICPMATGNGTGGVGVGVHVVCVNCETSGCKGEVCRVLGSCAPDMTTGAQLMLGGSSGGVTGRGGAPCRIYGNRMPENNRTGVPGGVLAPGQRVGRIGAA